MLTDNFRDALNMALDAHHEHVRKGTDVPYVSHLLAVAALVLEMGGDEPTAIAALLHDSVEDAGGMQMADKIRARFGDRITQMVLDVSEPTAEPRPAWRERKQAYLNHIPDAQPDSLRIILADKLHNSRATLRLDAATRWERFNSPLADQQWWYRSVLAALHRRRSDVPGLDPFLAELAANLRALFGPTSDGTRQQWLRDAIASTETFISHEAPVVAAEIAYNAPDTWDLDAALNDRDTLELGRITLAALQDEERTIHKLYELLVQKHREQV